MKIKKSTFYAFRILHRIDKGKGRVITSKEIAEKEELSQGVTLKILRVMEQAGIVRAHQGRGDGCGGGFSLLESIDKITVLDMLKILEGTNICTNIDTKSGQNETQMFWVCSKINEELEAMLSKYTVRNLFESDEAGSLLDTG